MADTAMEPPAALSQSAQAELNRSLPLPDKNRPPAGRALKGPLLPMPAEVLPPIAKRLTVRVRLVRVLHGCCQHFSRARRALVYKTVSINRYKSQMKILIIFILENASENLYTGRRLRTLIHNLKAKQSC